MSTFLDFQKLKAEVSIDRVLDLLGVTTTKSGAQLRSACPIHKGTDKKEFAVTPSKGLWHCFKGCGGGDSIKLVMKMRECDAREAARFIAEGTGALRGNTSPKNDPPSPSKRPFDAESYAKGLDPIAEALSGLGLAKETFLEWKAGYAKNGRLTKRLALPAAKSNGDIDCYFGVSLDGQEPRIKMGDEHLDPHHYLFGAERVADGELTIVKDPIQVLQAYESGIGNVVAFLTEALVVEQLEVLIALCHAKSVTSVSFF